VASVGLVAMLVGDDHCCSECMGFSLAGGALSCVRKLENWSSGLARSAVGTMVLRVVSKIAYAERKRKCGWCSSTKDASCYERGRRGSRLEGIWCRRLG
jgi:hypothetical protein